MIFSTPAPHSSGLHQCELARTGLVNARLSLQLPTQPRGAPLVLVLHYGGQPHGYYGEALVGSLVQPAWQALNAVIAAPVSVGGDWQSKDNLALLRSLLPLLEATYETNSQQRVITGYSLGAIGCWHQLVTQENHFSAAVPIAGRIPESLEAITTPFHALHSRTDQLFPLGDFEARVSARAAAGANAALSVVNDVDHFDFLAYLAAMRALVPWLQTIHR
ncbi:MAG: hypothetical protein EXR86_11245 [Gammaproteobacteria bacterium]|nr:hypothetical protein [Gammaproteobacteria bacterium]